MNCRMVHLACAWCGIATAVVASVGMWLAGFFPIAPSPEVGARGVAAMYQVHLTGIRVGSLLMMGAGALFLVFTATISSQMRRMESGASPVLTYTNLVAGTSTAAGLWLAGVVWTLAAFRPEQTPEITLALNDMAFLILTVPASVAAVQPVAIGLAILLTSRKDSTFPLWFGFLNLMTGLGYLPAGLAGFVRTGPFAWDGYIGWWIPFALFGSWTVLMTICLVQAINREAAEEGRGMMQHRGGLGDANRIR